MCIYLGARVSCTLSETTVPSVWKLLASAWNNSDWSPSRVTRTRSPLPSTTLTSVTHAAKLPARNEPELIPPPTNAPPTVCSGKGGTTAGTSRCAVVARTRSRNVQAASTSHVDSWSSMLRMRVSLLRLIPCIGRNAPAGPPPEETDAADDALSAAAGPSSCVAFCPRRVWLTCELFGLMASCL